MKAKMTSLRLAPCVSVTFFTSVLLLEAADPLPPTRVFTNANGEVGAVYRTPQDTAPGTSPTRVFTNSSGQVGAVYRNPQDVPAVHGPGRFFTNSSGEVGAIWDNPNVRSRGLSNNAAGTINPGAGAPAQPNSPTLQSPVAPNSPTYQPPGT